MDIVRMGWHSARTQPVATLSATLVVAVVCFVVLSTAGRAAAQEADVLSTIDSMGTRLITIVDSTGGARIDARTVEAVASLSNVSWAFGVGPAKDARNAVTGAGTSAPMRDLVGDLPAEIHLDAGRNPRRHPEGLVGRKAMDALGLARTVGGVVATSDSTLEATIVGQFSASGQLEFLNDAILRRADPATGTTVRYIYLAAASIADLDDVARAAEVVLIAEDPASVEIETPAGAVELRAVISGQLGANSRILMATVLGIGLILVAITMLGAVSGRRRDFGRQRALGSSRSAIVAMVLVQSSVAAVAGAAIGTAVGVGVNQMSGHVPPVGFVIGTATLAVLVTLAGSVPPAVAAALRDPVRILRVP